MSPLPADYVSPLAKSTKRGRQRVLSGIRHNSYVDPVVGDIDAFIETGVLCPDTATAVYQPGDSDWDGILPTGIPDMPRNAVVTVTHASSVVVVSGVISGFDINDKPITEAWAVVATGTTQTFTGAKAFKKITEITVVAAADATGNTLKFGTGNVFGLDTICSSVVPVAEEEDGAAPTAGTLVAGLIGAATDQFGTYAPNSTPNGALDFDIWYVTDNPEDSD